MTVHSGVGPEDAPVGDLTDLSEADLAVAAIGRLMRNGAVVLGHDMHAKYREGWFNALGFMASLLGHKDLAEVGYDLGHYDNDGDAVLAKAEAAFGPGQTWSREKWVTPTRG